MERRTFIATAGTGVVALAGCASAGAGGDDGNADSGDGGQSLEDHPAGRALADQPTLGDSSGGTVIVAFEDPSCTQCRRFEENTYPRIVSDIVEPGKAAFVYRGLPIIYPWGEPAAAVLEAAYSADPAAFWQLKDHYYAVQSEFSSDNVYAESRAFLDRETDADAEAVVSAARDGEADDAVDTDLDVGDALGIGQTPAFYLFNEGTFRTKIQGPQGYDVFASALGV